MVCEKSKKVESDIFQNTSSGRETSCFTAKELDEETGLYYYGARYLNPRTSRWISSDPAGFDLISPMEDRKPKQSYSIIESLNWYSYVSNNPIKYFDPTGFEQRDSLLKQFGSIFFVEADLGPAVGLGVRTPVATLEIGVGLTKGQKADLGGTNEFSDVKLKGSFDLKIGIKNLLKFFVGGDITKNIEGGDFIDYVYNAGDLPSEIDMNSGMGLSLPGGLEVGTDGVSTDSEVSATVSPAIGKFKIGIDLDKAGDFLKNLFKPNEE